MYHYTILDMFLYQKTKLEKRDTLGLNWPHTDDWDTILIFIYYPRCTRLVQPALSSKIFNSRILEQPIYRIPNSYHWKFWRILCAPDRLIVSCKCMSLFLLISHAIICPSPFMSAARWEVLFPGAAQASRTYQPIKRKRSE